MVTQNIHLALTVNLGLLLQSLYRAITSSCMQTLPSVVGNPIRARYTCSGCMADGGGTLVLGIAAARVSQQAKMVCNVSSAPPSWKASCDICVSHVEYAARDFEETVAGYMVRYLRLRLGIGASDSGLDRSRDPRQTGRRGCSPRTPSHPPR